MNESDLDPPRSHDTAPSAGEPFSLVGLPLADIDRVQRLVPEKYCRCYWQGLVYANASLMGLELFARGLRCEPVEYFAASAFSTFADLRPYPCPCWYGRLRGEVAKARASPILVSGTRFETALDATEQLWFDTCRKVESVFKPVVFRRWVRANFRERLRGGVSPPDDDRQHEANGTEGRGRLTEFVRRTLVLAGAIVETGQRAISEGARVREAGLNEVEIESAAPEVFDLLMEIGRFPFGEVTERLGPWVARFDLHELAAEVEAEFGRAVCSRCFSPKPRTRPRQDVHERWAEWHERGLSAGQIARRHSAETGEKVTRAAVAKALKRLHDL